MSQANAVGATSIEGRVSSKYGCADLFPVCAVSMVSDESREHVAHSDSTAVTALLQQSTERLQRLLHLATLIQPQQTRAQHRS